MEISPTPITPTPTETEMKAIESTMIGSIFERIVSAIRSIIEAIAKALGFLHSFIILL